MLNSWSGIGRLVRKPDLNYSESGTAICNFTLAIDRNYKNRDGERDTDFINCTAFSKTGEVIAENLDKGRLIAVEGELRLDRWKNKDGEKRSKLKVNVNRFHFLDYKDNKQNNTQNNQQKEQTEQEENGDFSVPF